MSRVVKFADSIQKPYKHWYENEEGVRTYCNDSTVQRLWFNWATGNSAGKDNGEDWIIFLLKEPVRL